MRNLTGLAVIAILFAGTAHGADYRTPRTRAGDPDLQGLWTNTSVTMLQRPSMFKSLALTETEAKMMEGGFAKFVADVLGTGPAAPDAPAPKPVKEVANADWIEMDMHLARLNGTIRSSWIVEPADGKLPFTEAGKAAAHAVGVAGDQNFENPEVRPTEERCLTAIGSPEGPPMLNTGFNGHYQIVQTPDHVAILVEMNHDVRIVRMHDRSHPPASVRVWMGDSVGWWEGDTLVVETTNFAAQDGVWSLGGGYLYSAQAKVTERFTRTAKDAMTYQFTVEDPVTFKQVWRGEMPMRTAKGPIYEYACHEGNYSLPNILAGARVQERAAAAAPSPAKP